MQTLFAMFALVASISGAAEIVVPAVTGKAVPRDPMEVIAAAAVANRKLELMVKTLDLSTMPPEARAATLDFVANSSKATMLVMQVFTPKMRELELERVKGNLTAQQAADAAIDLMLEVSGRAYILMSRRGNVAPPDAERDSVVEVAAQASQRNSGRAVSELERSAHAFIDRMIEQGAHVHREARSIEHHLYHVPAWDVAYHEGLLRRAKIEPPETRPPLEKILGHCVFPWPESRL